MPARISVGKCTNRYILLNAIRAAKANAASPAFLWFWKIATAPANEEAECVDGKEELVGLAISSAKSGSTVHGRGLEKRLFRNVCPMINTPI